MASHGVAYRHCGDVDIRNLKVVLNTERIQVRSVEMFHKELLTSLVAYNLVTQFRRQAAALLAQPLRRMSFKSTWTTFNIFLWSSQAQDSSDWLTSPGSPNLSSLAARRTPTHGHSE